MFNSIVQATVPALNALSILIVFLVSMALVGMQVRDVSSVARVPCETSAPHLTGFR